MFEATVAEFETRRLATEPPLILIHLRAPRGFAFEAGQYLNVVLQDDALLPLSIASPPEQLPGLTLHYRSTEGLEEARLMDSILATLTVNDPISIDGPHGQVTLAPGDSTPLVLICGGTGAAQAVALASAQSQRRPDARVFCLACADDPADLYMDDLLPQSCDRRLIADSDRSPRNRALQWLRDNFGTVDQNGESRIVICGGPPFVYAVTDTLTELGLTRDRLESDVYSYAPR